MPTLKIQLPGLPDVSHTLKDDTITIGRMKGNTIVVDHDSVSLSHARITRKDGEFFVKDLNSTNGTLVNGQSFEEIKLRHLDRIRFAEVDAQYFADAPGAPAARTPIDATAKSPGVAPAASSTAAPEPGKTAHYQKPRGRTPSLNAKATRLVVVLGVILALAAGSFIAWKRWQARLQETSAREQAAQGQAQVHDAKAGQQGNPPSPKTEPPRDLAAPSPAAGSAQGSAAPTNAEAQLPPPAADTNQDVTQLIALLKSSDAADRRRSVMSLHALGGGAQEAVPALRVALQDDDADVRMWAAVTLVNNKSYDKATIPILLGVLRHDNPVLRQVACLSLGLIPYEPAEKDAVVPLLKDCATKDPDEDVRKAAASALGVLAPQ